MDGLEAIKSWAKRIKRDALTLWFCARYPDTPFAPKLLATCLAAYAFSPIDLIPDFIPVIGLLDEMILLPLGIALCIKLTPPSVIEICRHQANEWIALRQGKPRSYTAAAIIVGLWAMLLWLSWRWLARS